MQKITLINFNTGLPVSLKAMGEDGERQKWLPVASLYLVGALEKKGFEVDFRDFQFLPVKKFYALESLANSMENSSDIIALSISADMLPFALLFCREIKKRFPGKKIILGGPGVKTIEERVIRKFPWIDVIVFGEAEKTLPELLDSILKGKGLKKIKGIAFRSEEKTFITPVRKPLTELDELPFPAYHKVNLKEYNLVSIITSRGCSFKCAFCTHSCENSPVRYRSIEEVVREIDFLASEFGCNKIKVLDDNFAFNKKRVKEFCSEIKKMNREIGFEISATPSCLDEDLMKELSEAGIKKVIFGIESASNKILERINKPFTAEQAQKSIKESINYFDSTILSFMWGFPFETVKEFRKTLLLYSYYDQLLSERIDAGLGLLIPLPESMLFKQFRHSLRFSEELSWNGLLSLRDSKKHLNPEMRKKIISMINSSPEIFSPFYYYHHKGIEEKNAILRESAEII